MYYSYTEYVAGIVLDCFSTHHKLYTNGFKVVVSAQQCRKREKNQDTAKTQWNESPQYYFESHLVSHHQRLRKNVAKRSRKVNCEN